MGIESLYGTPPRGFDPDDLSEDMRTCAYADRFAPNALLIPNLSLANAPKEWLESKRFILYMLRKNGEEYSLLPSESRSDLTILKTALTYLLLFAPAKISSLWPSFPQERRDEAVNFLQALQSHRITQAAREAWVQFGLGVLGTDFWSDPTIRPIILEQRQWVIEGPDQASLVNIRTIMEVEVQKNGLLLQICPDELRADPSFVKLAVSQNGEALQYALEPARSNMDVNLTAIGQTFKALQYVPTALRMNNQFLSEAIKRALLNDPTAEAFIMDCIPPEKFLDDAFAPLVLPLLPKLLPRFSENVRANKALVLPVLAKIGGYLSWVSEQLKLDTEVYLTAIQNDTSAYYSIPKSVLEDPAAVCTIVAANKNVYDLLPPKWQKDLRVMIAAGRILD